MEEVPIFDEWLDGQLDPVTKLPKVLMPSVGLSDRLAAADQLGVQVNIPVGSTLPNTFTLTVYHSQDGFRWFPKYANQSTGVATSQISLVMANFTASRLNVFTWGEPWPAPPSMRFVQYQLAYMGPGTRVTIFNTSRKRTMRARSAKEECDACMAAGDFPAHMRVLHRLSAPELAALRRVIKSPASAGLRARQRQMLGLGSATLGRLERSLNAAALQILGGKD